MKKAAMGDLAPIRMAASIIADKLTGGALAIPSEYLSEARKTLTGQLNTEIAATPYYVIYSEDRVKLKHYRPRAGTAIKTPLLVVYANINRETMLDLQPSRSTVNTFLESGLDVYMVDWGHPTRKDRYLTIEDHIDGYIDHMVDFILERNGLPQLNLMGICQGGTFCVIYSALYPEKIRNLVTTVTPTSFDTDVNILNIWARLLDQDKLIETYGNFPGDVMNLGFLLLNPARLMIDKYVGLMENLTDRKFVENFIRMERWIFDSPDFPGEAFKEFIQYFYKENRLIKNELVIGERCVDLSRLAMPILNIYAKQDHLVPPEMCDQYIFKTGSRDRQNVCLPTGHIGIYVSSDMQPEFAPRIVRWLKARDGSPERMKRRIKRSPSARSGRRTEIAG